jgi:16S rRNA (uracil1498-N3)-methyltransferase
VQVILYCSIIKRENFELMAQKATEVGVKEIVPLLSSRTIKLNIKSERVEKIIKEASEQSGRGKVPELHPPMTFKDALEHAKSNDLNLFFDPSGKIFSPLTQEKKIGVFIGPEGGWDEDEIGLARAQNFQIVSLGKLVLRAETAAIVASFLPTICS